MYTYTGVVGSLGIVAIDSEAIMATEIASVPSSVVVEVEIGYVPEDVR